MTGALSHVDVALTFGSVITVTTAGATDPRVPTPLTTLAMGADITLGALWGSPISGASINPARSFGPALVASVWSHQWIYWLSPIVGAGLGTLTYQMIRLPLPQPPSQTFNHK